MPWHIISGCRFLNFFIHIQLQKQQIQRFMKNQLQVNPIQVNTIQEIKTSILFPVVCCLGILFEMISFKQEISAQCPIDAPIVGTITQPACTVATGSVALSGLPAGNWTIDPGAIAGSGTTTTISGLGAGTYNYTVTNEVPCTSLPSVDIVINLQPATPSAPTLGTITHPTCSTATGSVVLNGLPAAGTWTLTRTPGGTTTSGTGTSSTISGLPTGTYTYTVTDGISTCTSAASPDVVINAQPATPETPTASATFQPTCLVSTGTITITAPTGIDITYSIDGSTYTQSSGIYTLVPEGTYNVTAKNGAGCISAGTSVTINAQPATPSAPTVSTITQPTCSTATGSVVLNGLPAGNWMINPGAIASSGTSATITGLASGTYTYTVTNAAGCTSLASADVIINVQPATPSAPTVGTITQPTCSVATGIVVLSGLPAGNWIINPGAIASSGTSTNISGLTASTTYNFTVTNSAGCTSLASADVIINVQPATPSAPIVSTITQPACLTSTGRVVLNGLPAGNWTINPGAIAGSTTSTTISGLTASTTYNFTVTNSAGCTSLASANVVIDTQPETPVVTNQTISILTGGTFTVTPGGVPAGTTYHWPAPSYTGGVTGGSAQPIPQTNISGSLTIPSGTGTATYNVTPTSGSCVGAIFTVTVTVTSSCVPVSIGTQPTSNQMCTTTGNASFTVSAAGTIPFTYLWQYNNGGTWADVANGIPSGAVYNNQTTETLGVGGITGDGSYQYRCYVTNCTGADNATSNAVSLTVNITPSAPTAGTITQPTCENATGSVVLSDLPSGNWTINPGAISSTGTSTAISGLATGTYTYTVTNAAGCSSLASAIVVIDPQPATPASPTVVTITQPTCAVATGSVVLSGLPAGTWTINPGAITGAGTNTTISVLSAGTYNYTVTNAAGCTSSPSANVVIGTQPETPVVTHQTISILTGGTFTLTPGGVPAGTTYQWPAPAYAGGVTGGSAQPIPQTNISGTLTVPSGAGTATYTVTPTSGACIGATFTVTVTVTSSCVPVSIETQPASNSMCTTTGNVSFTVSAAGTTPFTYQWQYNNGGTWTNAANDIPTGAVYDNQTTATLGVGGITGIGSYQYRCYLTNCTGVNNATSNTVTLTVNAKPSAPTAGTITQPTCAVVTGSVILNGLPATGTWIINPGAITGTGTSTTISGLVAGIYAYTVAISTGCTSAVTNIIINPIPDCFPIAVNDVNTTKENTPVGGNASTNDTPSSNGGNVWSLVGINGGAANGTITMNPDGTYTYTPNVNFFGIDTITYKVCDTDGDCSTATITITITSSDHNQPPVASDDYDTTNTGIAITVNILRNDHDPENGALTITLCTNPLHGTVMINNDSTITYTPFPGFSGSDSLCYTICDVGIPILCDDAIVYIDVLPLVIYNALTPNGDGSNDGWKIGGIEDFPENEVKIFNRWGDKIYQGAHYDNKNVYWNGTYKNNELLPDGIYFYILNIKGIKTFTGWIYLIDAN